MIPVAAVKGTHNKIETEKSDFAVHSKQLGRSSARGFVPNTLGTYRETEKRAQKMLRKELKRQRKHGK